MKCFEKHHKGDCSSSCFRRQRKPFSSAFHLNFRGQQFLRGKFLFRDFDSIFQPSCAQQNGISIRFSKKIFFPATQDSWVKKNKILVELEKKLIVMSDEVTQAANIFTRCLRRNRTLRPKYFNLRRKFSRKYLDCSKLHFWSNEFSVYLRQIIFEIKRRFVENRSTAIRHFYDKTKATIIAFTRSNFRFSMTKILIDFSKCEQEP